MREGREKEDCVILRNTGMGQLLIKLFFNSILMCMLLHLEVRANWLR